MQNSLSTFFEFLFFPFLKAGNETLNSTNPDSPESSNSSMANVQPTIYHSVLSSSLWQYKFSSPFQSTHGIELHVMESINDNRTYSQE